MLSPLQKIGSVMAGLIGGIFLFTCVQPAITGQLNRPVLDREVFIFFLFKTFPLLVVPVVCMAVAAMFPKSKVQSMQLGIMFTTSMLLPVPIVDEIRVIPAQYGMARLSLPIITEAVVLSIYLLSLSIVAAGIAGLVSPLIHRFVFNRKSNS